MHVMNQLHAAHIIRKVTSIAETDTVFYHMNAHSDDSGGKIQAPNELAMKKTFFIYELLLKGCNHMLSDKKCNISLRYFEFLSVLYISNKLLSLISKISGAFVFHPTDGGYCLDINECYSKCIEMISMGANFNQAYLALKISSHMIFKFYFNRDPSINDHLLPPQLLGMPDSHPLLVLICGSDSDMIRLTYNDESTFKKFLFLSNFFNVEKGFSEDMIRPISVFPNIRKSNDIEKHIQLIKAEDFDQDTQWVIKNIPNGNTGLNLLKYGLMLNDKKFLASLIDETVTRRISRAYFFRTHRIIKTSWGVIDFKTAKTCINLFFFDISETLDKNLENGILETRADFEKIDYQNEFNMYELMNFEVLSFIQSIENLNYTKSDIVNSQKTCKPIHINMQKTGMPTNKDFDPAELCIWIKFPNRRWMINLGNDYRNRSEQLKEFLFRHGIDMEKIDVNWLYNFLRKMKAKYIKEYFIYSNMPSDFRDVSSYQDFLNYLAHNSFKNKFVQGISVPLGITITQPISILFKNTLSPIMIRVLTFISFCFSLAENHDLFKKVCKLEIDSTFLECKAKKLYDLLVELRKKWEMHGDYSSLITPHLISLIKHMDGELYSAEWLKESYYYSFTKSQKLIGNVWLGKGILFISTPRIKIECILLNGRISHIKGTSKNLTFNNTEIGFINSVLMNANLPRIQDHFGKIDYSKWEYHSFGYNNAGLMCVDLVRNLNTAFPDYEYINNFDTVVSNPGNCSVKILKNFSYQFHSVNDVFGDKKYNVNVLKIQPTETLELLNKLYDNKKNREIVENQGEFFDKYFRMFVGEVSDAELRITQNQFFDLLQSTRIYAIMKDLTKKDLLSAESLKPRKHIYPGQHGGLLSSLIDYKNVDENFRFDYDLVLSPELMQLKSSQPEAFISNLLINIKEKYNALYTSTDKEIIANELTKIHKFLGDEKGVKNLMSLLTNWGYVGVMGSLEEMLFLKKPTNYAGIRLYKDNDMYVKLNIESLKHLINSIIDAAEKHNFFTDLNIELNHMVCKSMIELKRCIISYIHSLVLGSYSGDGFIQATLIDYLKIAATLEVFFDNDDFLNSLIKSMEKNIILSLIPVDKSNFNNFCIMLQTLALTFAHSLKNKHKLDFENLLQHDHDLIRPYTITKDFFAETKLRFKIKSAYHHGFISRDRHRFFNNHYIKKIKSRYVDVNFKTTNKFSSHLIWNKNLFLKKPIEEEHIEDEDSEFQDIYLELESDEPDTDTFDDEKMNTFYKPTYTRSSLTPFKIGGRPVNCKRFMVNVIYLPTLCGKLSTVDFVRNIGDTLLLITNVYLPDFTQYFGNNVAIFHMCNDKWENQSLLDPTSTIAYLIDSEPIDINLWESILDMHSLDKSSLNSLEATVATNMIIDENGNKKVLAKYSTLEDKLALLNSDYKEIQTFNDKDEEVEETILKIDDFTERLKKQGFDEQFIDEIIKYKAAFREKGTLKDFYDKILSYLDNSNVLKEAMKNELKGKIDDLVSNVDDISQVNKIFEVANVFSSGPPTKSSRQNRSLKDKYLRAEINSIFPGGIDYILSNGLAISKSLHLEFIKHCKAMRRSVMHDKKDREKKNFLIDLSCLILNDANNDDETNQDFMFKNLMSTLTNRIVEVDEEDEYDFLKTYQKESRIGTVYYDF